MKKMLLTVGAALAIAAVPIAAVSAYGYHGGEAPTTQTQVTTQDQTRDRDQLRLHDGTGTNHANCDGTPGDMHRYGTSD